MQSDGNKFCGDVVFDSLNKAFKFEESILDEIYEAQICSDIYYAINKSIFLHGEVNENSSE